MERGELDENGLDKNGLDERGLMPGMVGTLKEWLHRERMRSVPHRCSDGKWRLFGDDPASRGDGRMHTDAVLCRDGKWRPVAARAQFRSGLWDGTQHSVCSVIQAHELLSDPLPDGLLDGRPKSPGGTTVERIDDLLEAHAEVCLMARLNAQPFDPNQTWDWHALYKPVAKKKVNKKHRSTRKKV